MTEGLLGRIGALNALARSLIVATRDRWSRRRAVSAPEQAFRRKFARRAVRRDELGFTLAELLVALAIVGVLSAIAVPPLTSMIATQRVKTATFELHATLAYARSEAIKRNSVVTITPRGGNFANGYDLETGGEVLASQLGSPAVTINAPSGIALAFNGYGRLTTTATYQLDLSSAQDSSISKRCLVIGHTGRPSIHADNDHDGNCING